MSAPTEYPSAVAKARFVRVSPTKARRVINLVRGKSVADALDITMSGMSHANEFIMLIDENRWRVVEEPIEVLYTEYSRSKGQPLLNGVNIIFDGFLRGRNAR